MNTKQNTWCVAKPSARDTELRSNIEYACNILRDCKMIEPGGSCYEPNTDMNHASVVMNQYYFSEGRNHWNCDFSGSGLTVITDPMGKNSDALEYIFMIAAAAASSCCSRVSLCSSSSFFDDCCRVYFSLLIRRWCVAKPGTEEATLKANIDYVCTKLDCSDIQQGTACFNPNTLWSHASFAMNLFFHSLGRSLDCDFRNSGLLVLTDPSTTPFLFFNSICLCHNLEIKNLLFHNSIAGGIKGTINAEKTWCVAKPSSSEKVLQEGLDYACSKLGEDCGKLGPCNYPDTKAHRASFAMNLYYQSQGRQPQACDFKTSALIASSDPSYSKNCNYPGGEAEIPTRKTWCVAKPATEDSVLKDIINRICSTLDCSVIKPPSGPCYIPNNLWNNASVAMNLLYVNFPGHKCDLFNAGLLVVVDPSSRGSNNLAASDGPMHCQPSFSNFNLRIRTQESEEEEEEEGSDFRIGDMFFSQCLLSRKAPLGTIRVAAYCFKRLKKVQVKETDISFSVDKILQDEINDQTYRVLAALLLGVVRIYSKKVEYLFHDCNEVLLKIKKFRINTKGNGPMETLRASITIPERFELDTFDLEVSEDVGSGGNIVPQEEITLKDVWENERIGQFSLDKELQFQSEEFSCSLNLCSAANPMVEKDFLQSHHMDINFELTGQNSPTNLQEGKDTCSPDKQVNFGTDLAVEVLMEPVNMLSPDKHNDEEKTTVGELYEDEVQNNSIERIQSCGISQDNIRVSFPREVVPVVPFEPFNKSHLVLEVEDRIEARGNQMHQEAGEVHEARNSETNVEWIRDGQSYQEEGTLHNKSSFYKEMLKEHIEGSNEDNHDKKNLGPNEYISMESKKIHAIPASSIFIDLSPWFHDASTARRKKGATMPKDLLIPTPAAREGACFTRKRTIITDDVTVLSNEAVKQSICDTRDLISKRRKHCHTLLKARKEYRVSTLPKGFHDSLLPCHSSELQSLFSKKKMKISMSLEATKTPRKLDELESDIVASPKTPPRLSTIRSVEGLNDVTPLSPHEILRREQSLRNDDQLNLMNEENNNNHRSVGTLSSYEGLEGGQSLIKDEEHYLMNEDSNSFETRNSQSCAWTRQTRKVAMHLQRRFSSLRNQKDGEVNFSQAFGSKTRKECARLFYEILVLTTTDFVDAKQHDAYGDISIKKLPKWDETFGVDAL
ncbi:sister chromatid cohesion 1 protein 2-like [Prosopis cineraria]|uniref:sister chromatid cohesion 1 protein 2-like n=1 Tax=Prosopis cineraria TaxID=364024 RepID=UPI00240ED3B8|nr:sister chromatid cohesion 1 protein 2-like [Prosopis cineraria]